MKIQTTRRLLFSLVLSGMGFAAIAPGFSANPAQSLKLNQQGYGQRYGSELQASDKYSPGASLL